MSGTTFLSVANRITAALAAAVILICAMPVRAQDTHLSLSERVTRLEQQAQQNKGNIALVNQIHDLQSQNRQLQGQIEELQHEVKQLQDSSKAQYVDLDSRLRRLENGQGAAAPAAAESSAMAGNGDAPAAAEAPPAQDMTPDATQPVAAGDEAPAPAASAAAQQQQAQTDYDAAFKALRGGDFATSAQGFRTFIQQYPDSALVPNAYYWLGESYYITQNYPQALDTFRTLLQLYPDNAKSPGALLKVGYCQDELKQPDAATATLKSVIAKYPGSDVAKLAQQRLQNIQLQSLN